VRKHNIFVAVAAGALVGSSIGGAAINATLSARPGDMILVPSRKASCSVQPTGLLCIQQSAGGLKRGSYSVMFSGKKIEVVRNGKHPVVVFSAKQP